MSHISPSHRRFSMELAALVVDGRFVSSAGVSASIPVTVTVALSEAIAGHATAQALADRHGVRDWSCIHGGKAFKNRPGEAGIIFRPGENLAPVDISIADDSDEVTLALTADGIVASVAPCVRTIS